MKFFCKISEIKWGLILITIGGGFILSLTLSSILSVLISSLYVIYVLLKTEKTKTEIYNEEEFKRFKYLLLVSTELENVKTLKELYLIKGEKVEAFSDRLSVVSLSEEIFPIIKLEPLSVLEVLGLIKKTKENFITSILVVTLSEELETLVKEMNLNVKFLKVEEMYLLYKKYGENIKLPNIVKIKENKLSNYYKKIFTKKQSKKFLFSGIIITISSIFSFYPLYYIIFGGILMITSVLLRTLKKIPNS